MKYALTDLTKEELEICEAALENEAAPKSKKKAAKKVSKKTAPVEDEEEDDVDFDDEEDVDDEEEEEVDDDSDDEEEEEEEVDDEEEEEVPAKKKTSTKTSSTTSKVKLQDVMTESQAAHKRLTKKLKTAEKAQAKINALLKKHGAKNTRTLDPKKFAVVIKELKAL